MPDPETLEELDLGAGAGESMPHQEGKFALSFIRRALPYVVEKVDRSSVTPVCLIRSAAWRCKPTGEEEVPKNRKGQRDKGADVGNLLPRRMRVDTQSTEQKDN